MKALFYLSILIFVTALISCSGDEDQTSNPDMEEPSDELETAPYFDLSTFDGQSVSLDDFKDDVLVIFFFGNNCPPCKGVAPDIESNIHQAFTNRESFSIIGIDQWDGTNESVENFKKSTDVTFQLAVMGSEVASAYKTTYDRLVVVNKDGKIAFRGSRGASRDMSDVIDLIPGLLDK